MPSPGGVGKASDSRSRPVASSFSDSQANDIQDYFTGLLNSKDPANYLPNTDHHSPSTECGICGDQFRLVQDVRSHLSSSPPLSDYLDVTSSGRGKGKNRSTDKHLGIRLCCPRNHAYCVDCIAHYVRTKLADFEPESGRASTSMTLVIECPDPACSSKGKGKGQEWKFDDSEAARVLPADLLDSWVRAFISFLEAGFLINVWGWPP